MDNETLRRKILSDPDEPEGCPACGAIAGACSKYPNCPGGQMTTKVTIKNDNQGAPYADWDVELVNPDGTIEKTLKPGESGEVYLWHDGKALSVREVPKVVA